MGALISKGKSKVKPAPEPFVRQTSAPARLEGLEGTEPPVVAGAANESNPDAAAAASPLCTPKHSVRASSADAVLVNSGPLENRPTVKKIDAVGAQTDGSGLASVMRPAAIPIPDEARPWAAIFGDPAIRNFHSADWKSREEGLHGIIRSLQNAKFHAMHDSSEAYDATCAILCRALKDKVAPLYFAALEVFDATLSAFPTRVELNQLKRGLDSFLVTVLNRCGNTNARISELSTQAILSIARQQLLGTAYLGPHILGALPTPKQGASAAAGYALMAGRLELLATLLSAVHSSRGMAPEEVVSYCRPGLETPDDKVRHAAVRVVGEIYRICSAAGERLQLDVMLPGLKLALLQVLQRRCDEVAGELTSSSGTGCTSKARTSTSGGVPLSKAGGSAHTLPPLAPRAGFLPALPAALRCEVPPLSANTDGSDGSKCGGGEEGDDGPLGGGFSDAARAPPVLRNRTRMTPAEAAGFGSDPAPITPGRMSPARSRLGVLGGTANPAAAAHFNARSAATSSPDSPRTHGSPAAGSHPASPAQCSVSPVSPSPHSRSSVTAALNGMASPSFNSRSLKTMLKAPATPTKLFQCKAPLEEGTWGVEPSSPSGSRTPAKSSTPVKGTRGASRPRMPQEPSIPKVLDDAEEQLLESIMATDVCR